MCTTANSEFCTVPILLVCFFRSFFIPYYWVPSISNCFTTTKQIITLNIEKFTSVYNSKNVSCFTCAWMNCIYFISWWKQLNHFWINWFFCLRLKTLMQNLYYLTIWGFCSKIDSTLTTITLFLYLHKETWNKKWTILI